MPNLPTKRLILRNPPLQLRFLRQNQIRDHPPKHHTPPRIKMGCIIPIQIVLLRRRIPNRIHILYRSEIQINICRVCRLGGRNRCEPLIVQTIFNDVRGVEDAAC